MMDDWQVIATAPKDGSRMLLSVTAGERKLVVIGAYDGHWTGQCWVWENPRLRFGTVPDKWMPLPAPERTE